MGVSIRFGTFSDEKEEVTKTISGWTQFVDCQLVNTDLLRPVLKMASGKTGYNYCEISDFGRKYFIERYESIAGGHCLCYCHVDVLSTYDAGIRNLNCYVLRNEDINKWKRDIVDNAVMVSNRRVVYAREFGDKLVNTSEKFILGTIGDMI